jgi:hypothetical protein
MGHEAPATAIARLRSTWDDEVKPSARRALVAVCFTALIAAAHVGRVGTPLARAIAAGALALVAVALVVRAVVAHRRRADVRHIVRQTIAKTDQALGAATLRALTLVERAATDDRVGSPALASLHLSRLIGRASSERIGARAARAARAWAGVALGLAVLSLAAVIVEPFRIVEGLDVLAARRGEAPLPLAWIDDVEMSATPPDYLHEGMSFLMPFSETEQPRGTTISVRGRPIRSGRALVLTDGKTDVPFVDDGSDGVIARWTLGETTELFIAARFGAVRVRQPDLQPIASIPDEAPVVVLDGAPRTVKLLDEPSIALHYGVTDDHGLREVNLVLRSGAREERRVLSRPAGDARADRGGYELKAGDPFFKRTFAPVEVTVEARDNDPVSGPKWGKSAAIIVVPPQVGEPEALRYAAVLKARDALTDLLADRLNQKPPTAKDEAAHEKHEAEMQRAAEAAVEEALSGTYGGLRLKGRAATLARGQLRRLSAALDEEKKSTTRAKHEALIGVTEDVLLAFDSATRGLGVRDSRLVAVKLADVADELAAAAYAAGSGSGGASAAARLDAATQVLDGGGKQLLRLGDLGLDLGEIVANDLRRVARARQANDMAHAELAARDLAARLRRPEPSFGGGGGRGGVESGGPPSPDPNEASDADEEMMQGEQELEELARDHQMEMNEVAQALDRAVSKEELDALREEAKKHAQAIREAVRSLPQADGDPGSAEAAAAEGRAQAESMAGALEQGQPRDAVQSGKGAMKSLAEAKRLGDQSGGFFPEERAGRESARAREAIERELAWAEEALENLRRAASARAKDDLSRSSKNEEMLAERSKKLAQKGQSGDRSMPQEALDRLGEAEQAMKQAQRALSEGNGEEGFRHQQDAQRLLEMARGERSEDGQRPESSPESDDGRAMSRKADIPGKEGHKGPEDFRRRVLEGLGSSQDPVLKEAVKRYAEGLLR